MDVDQIKQAIVDSKQSLDEAYEKTDYDKNDATLREGWSAWEWARLQLLSRGMDETAAKALIQVYLIKQRRLGTYGAIQEMLFGDQVSLIFT